MGKLSEMHRLDVLGIFIFVLVTVMTGMVWVMHDYGAFKADPEYYTVLSGLLKGGPSVWHVIGSGLMLLIGSACAGAAVTFCYGIFAGLEQMAEAE